MIYKGKGLFAIGVLQLDRSLPQPTGHPPTHTHRHIHTHSVSCLQSLNFPIPKFVQPPCTKHLIHWIVPPYWCSIDSQLHHFHLLTAPSFLAEFAKPCFVQFISHMVEPEIMIFHRSFENDCCKSLSFGALRGSGSERLIKESTMQIQSKQILNLRRWARLPFSEITYYTR